MGKRLLILILVVVVVLAIAIAFVGCKTPEQSASLAGCRELVEKGLGDLVGDQGLVRPLATTRAERFLGKPEDVDRLNCRGAIRYPEGVEGDEKIDYTHTPWVDWANYWAAGDASTLAEERWPWSLMPWRATGPNSRGVNGALIDLEYQRMELIRFNLFDNYTWQTYAQGSPAEDRWAEMRLPPEHPQYEAVGGDGEQLCTGELIRGRTLTGICNDLGNPLMGATNTVFARNMQFEATFPDSGRNELLASRHGDRIGLLKPDPQLVSRRLLTREQSPANGCNQGYGLPDHSPEADCDYLEAPFFNVLAAFWIQFMTHDWFAHLEEGRNAPEYMDVGCDSPEAQDLPQDRRCRPDDSMERALVEQDDDPGTFTHDGREYERRAPRTFRNTVTAWWDASQIYGYDATSVRRVKRDPEDPARLLMVRRGDHSGPGAAQGYLPLFGEGDPINPAWAGQEATAFPDNFTIGMSFYHNVFAREHNQFVDHFREQARETPDEDSGLRRPADPERAVSYGEVTDDELYQAARLVVSAEIAKIHTIEWTTQLLYNEPLYKGMNSNWGGLFDDPEQHKFLTRLMQRMADATKASEDPTLHNEFFSILASGPGIFGFGSKDPDWSLDDLEGSVNGGINHFGSPFNFPEEFITVYRLHPLVPDLAEYRQWDDEPNRIRKKVPFVETFRRGAAEAMTEGGLPDWTLSMGRQRLGLLTLNNHAQFLQNLRMPRLASETQQIDVAALDLIRDRERGIPRYNEFRRQYGLTQLTSFDDFVDVRLDESDPTQKREKDRQRAYVENLRQVYGQHYCDASKVITEAQLNADGSPITDCLGHPDGTLVDNIEDVDTVVGWLAEGPRPHGFAISETQFVVFILNASRRLFSDRFFTSSFRPEFYTTLGHQWVMDNGPEPKMEKGRPNGHEQPVSPFKRVLQRTVPELSKELEPVVNVFDPWARDRGTYYSLAWEPRAGAESDDAFRPEAD